jgi:hypothetical protein
MDEAERKAKEEADRMAQAQREEAERTVFFFMIFLLRKYPCICLSTNLSICVRICLPFYIQVFMYYPSIYVSIQGPGRL